MKMAYPGAEALVALDNAHYLHPFTDHKALREKGARLITRADGVHVWDAAGHKILDGMAGLWCVNVGYGRKELADAAARQMMELPYYNSFFKSATVPPVELAKQLVDLAPKGISNVFYASSGSESNDTVIRLVRHYWKLKGQPERNIIIARKDAYHGSTIASASMGGMSAVHKQIGITLPGFSHVMPPYWYGEALEGESQEEFGLRAARAIEERILELGADKVAAVIGEPIMGAGGVRIPPETYWPEVERICRKYDVLLVADEVITGFGRTGHWFGSQRFGFTPDLMTVAKGITSGYLPLSAVLVGERVVSEIMEKGGEFYHGYTYSGHPVACAVALENLDIIRREGLVEQVRNDTGPALGRMLQQFADHPIVGEVRSDGLVAALEIVRNKKTRERYPGDGKVGTLCRDICFLNNLVMRAVGDTMILAPPLTFSHDNIAELEEKIRHVLDDTARGIGAM